MEEVIKWEGPDGNIYSIPEHLWEDYLEDLADAELSGEYYTLSLHWGEFITKGIQ